MASQSRIPLVRKASSIRRSREAVVRDIARIIPRALQEKASQRVCERADCREGLFLEARSGCREGREPGSFGRIQGREYPRFATIEAPHGGAAQVTFLGVSRSK